MLPGKKHTLWLILLLVIVGAILRFYNLNWGAPYYFHPDERNIASSVSQLSFPKQMNPHFFAYGSLPIYSIYFTGVAGNILSHCASNPCRPTTVTFAQAIIISRFFSAVFSLLLIPLLFFITKRLWNEKAGVFAAILTTFSTGLIQFAHFGTFELWLTFFSVLLFWLCLKSAEKLTLQTLLFLSIVSGVLVSTKISHLAILPLPLITIFSHAKSALRRHKETGHADAGKMKSNHLRIFISTLASLLIFAVVITGIYFVTNPFVVLDYHGFTDSIRYESSVALGTLKVFYTGEFLTAIPVVFQLLHIYPFLLNPLLTVLLLPVFSYVLWLCKQTRKVGLVLLCAFFIMLFVSQAFVYAKWTRYMVPTLPFIYLMLSVAIDAFFKKVHKYPATIAFSYIIIVGTSIIFSLSYVMTAYVEKDTRIAARDFAASNISSSAPILSEVYDIGITAFNEKFPNIVLFNFYDLDNNSFEATQLDLQEKLAAADYIILPSQRIMKIRLEDAKKFPLAHGFYEKLFSGQLGFTKIYETPCDIFCKIAYLGNPVFNFEETATVFDRPTIYIFKK